MFEVFSGTAGKEDAISILKDDHSKVKDLFEQFENAETLSEKKRIAQEAITELKIHAEIEEKLFYPAVRRQVESDLMNEADEEHHVAKLLIAELDQMDGSESHWEAKFTVLAENIRHHIKEEENEMMPQARKADLDFEELGQSLMEMKRNLKLYGIPASDEEKLFAKAGTVDSPARAARASKSATKAKPKAKTRPAVKAKDRSAAKAKARPAATKAKAKSKAAARNTVNVAKSTRKAMGKSSGAKRTAKRSAMAAYRSKSRSGASGRRHA